MRITIEARWVRADITLFEKPVEQQDERGPGFHSADLSVSTSDAAEGYGYDDSVGIGYTRR